VTLQRHLVIFAKTPRLGTVKNRLAAGIGPVAATGFYRQCLGTIVRRLSCDTRWHTTLAVTPERDALTGQWWPHNVPRLAQGPGNLGDRMDRVARTMPPGPVVIIGTDIPDIAPRHIHAAFTALGDHEAVFGPSEDGGYWLVGLRRRPVMPDLFTGIRWSTRHALADTRANLPPGTSAAMLESLIDVDEREEYLAWRKR